jgi:hypothetical protein
MAKGVVDVFFYYWKLDSSIGHELMIPSYILRGLYYSNRKHLQIIIYTFPTIKNKLEPSWTQPVLRTPM